MNTTGANRTQAHRRSLPDTRRVTRYDSRKSLTDELQGRKEIMTEQQRQAALKSQKQVVDRLAVNGGAQRKNKSDDALTASQIECKYMFIQYNKSSIFSLLSG